jgi:colanic acid/amylovoran biosynthesis glycosyltransferase
LFVGKNYRNKKFICPVKVHPNFSKFTIIRIIQSILLLIKVLITAPKPANKLFNLARKNEFSYSEAIQLVIINSTILPYKLDWLHFGFATTAIKRELVGKAIGAKVAVSFRGFDISIYPLKNKNCFNLLWNFVDRVHTISNDLLRDAYLLGLPKHVQVYKITPAILIKDFHFDQREKKMSNPISILTVARLHWKKGIEDTLEALSILKKEGRQFNYKIAGDGVEFERLNFAIHQLEIEDSVEFLGVVSHTEVKQLMRDAHMYIQYSIQEGFCNSVLEAQASGMACLVSDAEGLPENVLDGQTGWVVPKRSPQLLARKIAEVLEMSNDERNSIISNARARVEKEFNIEKQRQQFVEFYLNI